MLQIGHNTIVSFDIIEKNFCCDLTRCKGICCVEGDAGAPLLKSEVRELEAALPYIYKEMTPEAKAIVDQQGTWYRDQQGDMVTSIVNNRDCAFAYHDTLPADQYHPEIPGCCLCLLEKACREGKTKWLKPISCHLYPIRITEYPTFIALNYHEWDVCKCARELGDQLQMPVYKFLREPLIRRFGQEWYDELCLAAEQWMEQKKRKANKKQ